jgi:hypothetical protein
MNIEWGFLLACVEKILFKENEDLYYTSRRNSLELIKISNMTVLNKVI